MKIMVKVVHVYLTTVDLLLVILMVNMFTDIVSKVFEITNS